MPFRAQERIWLKTGAVSGLGLVIAFLYGILADALNLNRFIVPFLSGLSLRSKVEAGCCASTLIVIMVVVAIWNINIRLKDVQYER